MDEFLEKAAIDAAAAGELADAHTAGVTDLLEDRAPANLVGVGVGVKWTGGEPTGTPAVLLLVDHKVEEEALAPGDRLPGELANAPTDVVAIGRPVAGGGPVPPATVQALTVRSRPARSGSSVGHPDVTAGTIGTGVYEQLPGATRTPPAPGIGIPRNYYILSNNHVLANSNAGRAGDPILQPGPADGGKLPQDRIAELARFVPIDLAPRVPLVQHNNLVDAALALARFEDIDREIYWIGRPRVWRRRSGARVGELLQKTGRTTSYTLGRVISISTTVDINYREAGTGRFRDQIISTNMSAGGDSGSVVLTLEGAAVGLLFAGSSQATIINHIEHVRDLLKVEVAEQVA
jgi:hypothetical protein